MFRVGEYVMYSGEGLCRVEAVGIPDHLAENREYYFLRSVHDHSRIYAPTDTKVPMRRPLTETEAIRFLEELPLIRVVIPGKLDSKRRMDAIRETVRPQTAEALIRTIIIIRSLHPEGKFPVYEKTILTRTEKSLFQEIAYALRISEEDAAIRVNNAVRSASAQG